MKGSRKLGKEERVLWGKVAKTTRPISGRLEDLLAFDDVEEAPAEPVLPQAGKSAFPRMLVEAAEVSPATSDKKPKIHQPLEKPVKRKLTRGRLPLEGRIDLHGMFQSEAHAVLLDFLLRAHERGLRHVLVITGKGRSIGSDGALKRAVPMWFSKPEYRYLISSYEDASANHGGDGALYVRLSRRRGEKS
ncbi:MULTISPECIES: Smr/MutS family protein [unclassified Agrobacterium]|uniref:Smr/MutS family protein n=1 Tax=unclassified Agrobacterium TaxID=2632611 RepID=UPI00244C87CF|nr:MULTISPECIES: Smr/MutS family protein [unclassified Agrobacterium]MDH0614842.1 Smr/MutS family protein [Agrobacterium sp. GD03872]MDH0696915.1 Smr/MutS family protein [Agrobacterium sp. GD03871]MDH1059395.1 Smr/MutS family protein [Agrobacterium sp. GD03992]MDH2212102.1 Smr/MutS family protein [Agrobacterium sp. GD03643]MDH2220122.1 Smr/MutS family protein [Agrobacterium sp. GD03638]